MERKQKNIMVTSEDLKNFMEKIEITKEELKKEKEKRDLKEKEKFDACKNYKPNYISKTNKRIIEEMDQINNKEKYKKEKLNEKDKKSKFRISKGAEPFSFSKYGINNMKLKTVKKIEDIKNRYINKKKEIKFDENYYSKFVPYLEIDKFMGFFGVKPKEKPTE